MADSATIAAQPKLVQGPVLGHLLRLSAPMAIGIASLISFTLVDTWFIAQLGQRELAAMGFIFPVIFALGSLAFGLAAGTASLVARAEGSGDRHRVRCLTTDALIISLFGVGCLVVPGLATIDPLFRLLGAPPDLLPLIAEYMRVWYPGLLVLVVPMIGNSLIRATGDTITPAAIMLFAGLINAGLDPLLIFGLAGLPRLELEGAAMATVLARAAALLAALAVLHYREQLILWAVPPLRRLVAHGRELLAMGLPAAGQNVLEPVAVGVITAMIAGIGTHAVAGFGVATRIEAFAFIPAIALVAGVTPFIGQNWGAGRLDRVRAALRTVSAAIAIWGVITAVLLMLAAGPIARLFTDEPAVVDTTALYLLVVPITYVAEALAMMLGSAWLAMGRPWIALVLTLGRYGVIYIPAAWWGLTHIGVLGAFLAAAGANLLVGALAVLWMRRFLAAHVTAMDAVSITTERRVD